MFLQDEHSSYFENQTCCKKFKIIFKMMIHDTAGDFFEFYNFSSNLHTSLHFFVIHPL